MTAIRVYAAGQWREPQYFKSGTIFPSTPDEWLKYRPDSPATTAYPFEGDFTTDMGGYQPSGGRGSLTRDPSGCLLSTHTAVDSAVGEGSSPSALLYWPDGVIQPNTTYQFGAHFMLRSNTPVYDTEVFWPTSYFFLYYGKMGVDEPNLRVGWQTDGGLGVWVYRSGTFTTPAAGSMTNSPYHVVTTSGDPQGTHEVLYDNVTIRNADGSPILQTIPGPLGQRVRVFINGAWVDQDAV